MLIRPERREDADVVRSVHAAAFPAGSGGVVVEAALVEALRRSGDLVPALSLVAEVDGVVVGHVAVSRGSIDGVLGVAPLGVVPEHQGCGVGSGLMHSVVAAAEALWYRGLVVLGDPAYYGRFGFEAAARHGIVPGHPQWPAQAFQVRPLPSSWSGPYPAGTVFRYAEAIEGL